MTGKSQTPVLSPLPVDRPCGRNADMAVVARRKSYPLPEVVTTTGGALAAASDGEDQPSDRGFDRYIEAGVVKSSGLP